MLRYKITPKIKEKMLDAIKDTIETGDEHSFFMCIDDKGDLSTTPKIRGTETKIIMGPPVKCPFRTQGNFHTMYQM